MACSRNARMTLESNSILMVGIVNPVPARDETKQDINEKLIEEFGAATGFHKFLVR
jgi:hypothetical protein